MSTFTPAEFSIKSREDAELFVLRHNEILVLSGGSTAIHFSLADAFTNSRRFVDGTKIFAAIFDIYINSSLVWLDTWDLGCLISEMMCRKEINISALDSADVFALSMREHRYASSFVFRYRALWDKLMGLLVMLAEPAKYERYVSAQSRKRDFKKICAASENIPNDLADQIFNVLTKFDNDFRTPEAHGTGRLRKFTFAGGAPTVRIAAQLTMQYWNILNHFLHDVAVVLAKMPGEPPNGNGPDDSN